MVNLYDEAPRLPSVEEFYGLLNDYQLQHNIIPSEKSHQWVYGRINFNAKKIELNPLHNQDGITLAHEFTHLYFEDYLGIQNVNESQIEDFAHYFYSNNKNIVDKYCKNRLSDVIRK